MLAMMGSIGAEIGAVVSGAGTVSGSLFSRVKSVGTSGVGFISKVSGAGGGFDCRKAAPGRRRAWHFS